VVFVQTQTWWTTTGHLWWRRFREPRELPLVWVLLPDGQFHYYVLLEQDVPSLVDDWGRGRLGTFNDVELVVDWLDEAGSARVREELGLSETPCALRGRCGSPATTALPTHAGRRQCGRNS
jgi:hypothetical protein